MNPPRLQFPKSRRADPVGTSNRREVRKSNLSLTTTRTAAAYFLTLVVSGSLFLASGCKQARETPAIPEVDLSEAYDEVRDFLTSRRRAVEKNVESGAAWGQYAMALDAHEYTQDAVRCYKVAARLDPDQSRWKYLLAIKLKFQSPEQAEGLLAQITKRLDSGLPELLCHVDVLNDLGRMEAADKLLETAKTRQPSHPAVLFRLARRAFEEGRLEDSARHIAAMPVGFRESTRLNMQLLARTGADAVLPPNASRGHNELPSVDETISDPYMAAVFRQRRDPLWTGKQAAERAANGDDVAYRSLKELVSRHPQLEGNRLQLALLMAAREGDVPAENIVREGLKRAPESARLLSGLAALSIMNQDWQASKTRLQNLLAVAPESKAGWSDLGFVLENMSQWDESIAAYDHALSLMPNDPELAARRAAVQRKKKEADFRKESLPQD